MSHVPLLSQKTAPKLQPPRRGPQLACLCLLGGLAFLLMTSSFHAPLMGNATRARVDPPPAAVLRIIDASTQHRLLTEETLRDLLSTVRFLAERELAPR